MTATSVFPKRGQATLHRLTRTEQNLLSSIENDPKLSTRVLYYGEYGVGKSERALQLAGVLSKGCTLNGGVLYVLCSDRKLTSKQVRDMKIHLSYGGPRVVILDEVQSWAGKLSQLHGLLDSLRPTESVIAVTDDPESLETAFASRFLHIFVKKLSDESALRFLRNLCRSSDVEASDEALKKIVQKSGGHIRNCLFSLEELRLRQLR